MVELICAYASQGIFIIFIVFLVRLCFDIVVDAFRGGR